MNTTMIMLVSVVVPILIVVILLFALRGTLFGPSKAQRQQAADLMAAGRKARATIVRVDPTGMVVNNINLQCWVTFRMEYLDGGAPFEGRKKILINQTKMPRAGDIWPAWVSTTDPTLFAVGMPDGASPEQIPMFREFGIPHPLDQQPVSSTSDDTVDELQKLVDLKDRGLLTDTEFTAAKSKLLGG